MLKVGFLFVFCSSVFSYGLRLLIHRAQCLEYDHCGKGAVFGGGERGAYPHLLPHATATRDRPCGRFLYYHNIQLLTYRFNLHESLSIRFCVSSSF